MHFKLLLSFLSLVSASGLFAQSAHHYAIFLQDAPVAEKFVTREHLRSAAALNYRQQIQERQNQLRAILAAKRVRITGSADTVLNAIFVTATPAHAAELSGLAGVRGVVELRHARRFTNKATQLVNAPAAWTALGGTGSAGAGIKIAILDTGIDQTNPSFQDNSLSVPAGFPVCSGFTGACSAYTNNKVIVARSYVQQLAAGSDPNNPAADSRPDDYTPRDHDGHGTAVASVAAAVSGGITVTFNGMAPKAFLGNYKVFGTPTVNDSPPESVFILAIEDAIKDKMDIANVSAGFVARYGALDTGAACGLPAGTPCDPVGMAFENAAKSIVIVASAGNSGFDGDNYPTFNSIATPAAAPSVIAVGASLNSHFLFPSVSVIGTGAPSSLQGLVAEPSDAITAGGAFAAPLVDVTTLGNDGLGCNGFPAGSLFGSFALIMRGTCPFADKVTNTLAAGGIGVVIYMADGSAPISPQGIFPTPGPAVMISQSDGMALKAYIDANPSAIVAIDAAGREVDGSSVQNLLATFTSFGPTTGDALLKPELMAPGGGDPLAFLGAGMYVAAQSYDPLGGVYSANGYAAVDSFNFASSGTTGTSMAAPVVAGAAALVKQRHPGFTPAQVKSALVNAANTTAITQDDQGNDTDTFAGVCGGDCAMLVSGNGLLDAGAAVNATVTSAPATFSFGGITKGGASQQVQLTNAGSSSVTLTATVNQKATGSGVTPTLDKSSVTIAAGASAPLTLALNGSSANSGTWSGTVSLQGSGVSMQIPYVYMVPDGATANLIPEVQPKCGPVLDNSVGADAGGIQLKVVDDTGLPVPGATVTFAVVPRTGATLQNASAKTDNYGIASAEVIFGGTSGDLTINAAVGKVALQTPFSAFMRQPGVINDGGVVGAGNSDSTQPVAIGSLILINGSSLAPGSDETSYARLPIALDGVMASFDVPSANPPISVPGHVAAISATQVAVQVPWELHGQASALLKVTQNCSYSNVVTVSLADYAPAWFENSPGVLFALDGSGNSISTTNPAKVGQPVTLIANGLGPVSNQPASGDSGLSSPQSSTTTQPTVMIGGQAATVRSSILAPGVPGQYAVTVTVPSGVTGSSPATIAIGGQTSLPSNLQVQ